jgi:acyl-CoA hydrolase
MCSALKNKEFSNLTELAEDVFKQLNGNIIMGIPIGVGKAIHMINAFYAVAKANPHYKLEINSALSLNRPKLKTELEKRLLEPFFDRQFKDLPELDFANDVLAKKLPANVNVVEFYFKPGEVLKNPEAQQFALSSNYTHVPRDLLSRGCNVICQMITKKTEAGKTRYSLGSNPDVTLDVHRLMHEYSAADGKPRFMLGQVNTQMPFMPNDAEIDLDFFEYVHDDPALYSPIFATPYAPISPVDHMIGFYTSLLIKDEGSLQIGIGSLGDAVVNSLLVRHNYNDSYRQLVEKTNALKRFPAIATDGALDPFEHGLYGNTEMLVPGYMALKKGGVLKRKVYDDEDIQQLVNEGLNPNIVSLAWLDGLIKLGRITPHLTKQHVDYLQQWGVLTDQLSYQDEQLILDNESIEANLNNDATRQWIETKALGKKIKGATLVHAGFFVGGHGFYDELRNMPEEELNELKMTSVMFTNQIKGNETLKLRQMKNARFINTCMKTTLAGASASDGLADGKVVSGVGGQFNFVTMGHEFPDSRSILMMRSTRRRGTEAVSNIVFNYGHVTVPRHMRDIVVTEYGIADLRAKTDQEIIIELLKITDSRFQNELMKKAKKAGKLRSDYQLPEYATHNTPEALNAFLSEVEEHYQAFPFGCDLTEQEVLIGGALRQLKANVDKKWPLIKALFTKVTPERRMETKEHLERLGLYKAKGIKQKILRKLVISVLPSEL